MMMMILKEIIYSILYSLISLIIGFPQVPDECVEDQMRQSIFYIKILYLYIYL